MAKRSIVYVDGFNLYYGALRGSSYRWLNLEQLFKLIRQDDEIVRIRYFTARTQSADQDIYLKALQTLPLIFVEYGLFKSKVIKCRVSGCSHAGT